ncbi:hypothetical protein BD309DRAFT_1020653 [Dichomitus squalens]|nr:hypothetical protein BD309DRAFT_1020653 [Dichomitus squalens]
MFASCRLSNLHSGELYMYSTSIRRERQTPTPRIIQAHILRRAPWGDATTGVIQSSSVALDDLCSNSVSACVGLGHKYEINYVVRRGGNDLKKFFVENLDTCARVDPPRPPAFKGSIPSVRSAELVNGFAHEDGKPEKLSPEDIGRCFLGRANLMQANTQATLRRLCPDALRGLHAARRRVPVFLKLLTS